MVYDDTPLYEQNKKIEYLSNQKWKGLYPSASVPSQLYLWLEHNYYLRRQGKINEIDSTEIEVALKGVKNKWHPVATEYKKECEEFLSKRTQETWEKIRGLRFNK